MKPESIIKAFRNDLRKIVEKPCECQDIFAVIKCAANKQHSLIMSQLLDWVLDESSDLDGVVEAAAKVCRL